MSRGTTLLWITCGLFASSVRIVLRQTRWLRELPADRTGYPAALRAGSAAHRPPCDTAQRNAHARVLATPAQSRVIDTACGDCRSGFGLAQANRTGCPAIASARPICTAHSHSATTTDAQSARRYTYRYPRSGCSPCASHTGTWYAIVCCSFVAVLWRMAGQFRTQAIGEERMGL